MKHKHIYGILAAALASALFGAPSMAASLATSSSNSSGTGTANANNAGIGNSSAGSNSGAYSGATANGGSGLGVGTGGTGGYAGSSVNFTYNDPPGPATETIDGTQRLVTTGAAIAPSIYNNNVCSLGLSAAAGFMGGAFAIGGDRVDHDCNVRANASLLGHFAEIYSIAAAHAPDPQIRQLAEGQAAIYAQWANNYLCAANPELAATAPPGSHFCPTVATQAGLQVVPAPVAYAVPPKQVVTMANPPTQIADPPRALVADPPAKPRYDGPHIYGSHEGGVPTSWHTGPISGYNGPDYSDDDGKMRD